MLQFLLLATTTAILFASASILYAIATRESGLMPATVNPFAMPASTDIGNETMPLAHASATTLAGDWQTAELATLHQVEDLMDWLENHQITTTELSSMNGKFVVRWR
jgi:hypothetical protein